MVPTPSYPALEAFAERASAEDAQRFLQSAERALAGLKGPASAKGEKVALAIARTRELLELLVNTRIQMEAAAKSGRPR